MIVKLIIRIFILTFLLYSSALSETIFYQSYNPKNFEEIFSKAFYSNSVELTGELILPGKKSKYPVVVLQHGTGDNKNKKIWYKALSNKLLENGIGVFINDSYKNRNIKGSELTLAPRVLDGLFALEAISSHPHVDYSRIGIQGYSYGGMVAFFTAYKELADLVNNEYAAHMPVYPGCDIVIKHMEMTKAPIKMIIAEMDDYAPAIDCIEYGPEIGEIKIYNGAHHGFINTNQKKEFLKDVGHFNNCERGYIQEDGKWYYNGKVRSGAEKQILSDIWKECGSKGVHIGGTRKHREMLIRDTVDFFIQELIKDST